MPPEKLAYALARYSRSPDSIRQSVEWVRTHDSQKFLESFYFQYGHASIADLGHLALCFEGISELAAIEIEDEQLWDGQARSSRYQNFGRSGFVIPPELTPEQTGRYRQAGDFLLQAYSEVHAGMVEQLRDQLPRPDTMKADAYERNIAARAFDVARYLLFLGIPTGVGQVTSIRTLERQIRRLRASGYAECRELAEEAARACAQNPECSWDGENAEAVAPTLARHLEADEHLARSREDLRQWAAQNLPASRPPASECVDVLRPDSSGSEIAATLLYPVCDRSFRELYEMALEWSEGRRQEVLQVALQSRSRRDELLRAFRTGTYCFDIVMDIGAYRDFHRHRRCQQFRQDHTGELGYELPPAIREAGLTAAYSAPIEAALRTAVELGAPAGHYILPFAARGRYLFKMDFAEAEYICRLRTGVKGHFSYRQIAWEMKEKLSVIEPELAPFLQATSPSLTDPLQR